MLKNTWNILKNFSKLDVYLFRFKNKFSYTQYREKFIDINEKYFKLSTEQKLTFDHKYESFELEYVRFASFLKKDLENFLIAIKSLLRDNSKANSFLNELLILKRKNTPNVEALLFYKKNLKRIEVSLEKMNIKESLIYLYLLYQSKIVPDEFLQKLYENIDSNEIMSLEATNLNKLIWAYSNLNYLQRNIQDAIRNKLKFEWENCKSNLFGSNNINKYIKSLALFCSLNYEETIFCHETLLDSYLENLEIMKSIDKSALKFIWTFITTLNIRKSSYIQKSENLSSKIPFHKLFLVESNLQRKFKLILQELCKDHKLKFEEEKKVFCYFVDFFVEPNIIFEINGPFHYVNCNSFRKFGYDEIRYRNLLSLEYKFHEINYSEWLKMDSPSKVKKYYFSFFFKF